MPPTKDEIVRAVVAERRATLALLRPLDPARFDTPTALPGWRVLEVVAHLLTTDRAAVTGAILPQMFRRSTDGLEAWNETQIPKWANRPIPELLAGLEAWGRRFARLVRSAPAALYRLRLPSAWGREPVAMMAWIRAYDEWVHRQDIRRALDMGDQDVDLASIAEFLLTQIDYSILPKLGRRPGTIVVALAGLPLPAWRYDLTAGTGAPAGDGEGADARITAPAAAFIMAAAGRDRFDDLKATGALTVEGDQTLAARFLDLLRIV